MPSECPSTGAAGYSERPEVLLEARIGDRGGLHADHLHAFVEASPATAPSIAMRWSPCASIVPPRSGEPSPRTTKPSGGRLDVRAEAAQPLHHGRDTVGFLEAELLGALHDGLALGVRAEQRHQRQLVDRERYLVWLDHGAPRAAPRPRRARRPARSSASVPGSSRSPTITAPIRSAIRRKPVRVQLSPTSFTTTREPPTRVAAATMKAADDGSPGHDDLVELELVHLRHRDPRAVALERHARAAQQALGVVAARRRLDDGRRARGHHPGDQHARLHLRARDRELVLDPGELGAAHREGREAAVASVDRGAHHAERLGHAVHRPAANRAVAVERPDAARLPGEPARQQPHERAGVAHVDAVPPWPRAARAGPRRGSRSSRRPPPPRRRRASSRRRAWSACPRSRGSCARPPARRTSRRSAPRGARSTCPPAACSRPGAGRREGTWW